MPTLPSVMRSDDTRPLASLLSFLRWSNFDSTDYCNINVGAWVASRSDSCVPTSGMPHSTGGPSCSVGEASRMGSQVSATRSTVLVVEDEALMRLLVV